MKDNMSVTNYIWSERFRPRTIDECILPEATKTAVKEFVAQGRIPNFLFAGSPGTGKTTLAKAICNELKAEYLFINASNENGIDVLRTKIAQFASTISLTEAKKVVILDESDYLNQNSVMPALRGFIEEFSSNVSFIFTCNYKNRIIEPLQSRLTLVEFKISKTEKQVLASQMLKRACFILEENVVPFDKKVVAALVAKFFPDFRKTISELQRYSTSGTIDSGVLQNFDESSFKELINSLKEKNFGKIRQWVANNSPDSVSFFRKMYDEVSPQLVPQAVPQLILHIAEYQYKASFVADQEVNIVAFLIEVLRDCQFQ
jgi:DNA polymerase III delta prime subunit